MPSEITGELADKIREKGHEFGTTTGRPRRIGWLDTVVLNHSKRVSGLSYLAITLLDVLSGLDKIKIVTAYQYNGEIINHIPADIEEIEKCKPIYKEVDGWQEDITQVKSFHELPLNAQRYLNLIEKLVGLKVAIFSVGPDREQTIITKNIFEES
jgi:adenylosuccinate synthase